MPPGHTHPYEPYLDIALVSRLVAGQFPQWADLAIQPVDSAGTQHEIYRLGRDKAVRLPRHEYAIGQAEKELRWLPQMAPSLPLSILSRWY